MAKRLDAVTFKKNEKTGKTFAVRLGSATESTKGDGYNIYLDAMPAPENGQYRISLVTPRDRSTTGAPQRDDLNDDMPF